MKEDEYLRDGITEDITTELSKIKRLKTFSRAMVLSYRDKSVTAGQVGRDLGASYVLVGSLRRAGNRDLWGRAVVEYGGGARHERNLVALLVDAGAARRHRESHRQCVGVREAEGRVQCDRSDVEGRIERRLEQRKRR